MFIALNGLHKDSKYFADPLKYDPDRFSEERKHEIHPMTYLPFGDGPRICIGNNSYKYFLDLFFFSFKNRLKNFYRKLIEKYFYWQHLIKTRLINHN